MINVREVTKRFGIGASAVTALETVSLDVPEGSFFTLLGPSGCGKTTLLRLIAGFELPSEGEIALDGQEIGHLPPHKRPVNTVFQNYALFPHMTVARNIGFGLEMLNRPKAEIAAAIDDMLNLVQMGEFASRRVDQLSGGQQQRVALARALAPRPKVLLLDEPLSALDLKLRKGMQSELKRLQSETGITFVFVTHDQGEALAMSDQIAVMSAGRVQQVGTPQQIYTAPQSRFVADFIGDTNIVAADLLGYDGAQARISFFGGEPVLANAASDGLPPGVVYVALRPETLTVCAASNAAAVLRGTVLDSSYFGAGSQMRVRLQNGTEIQVQVAEPSPAGSEIGLIPETSMLHVLAD
ncbi:spermidine/putrescine ABC transporter ATP-binding protein [Phaeobacter gallaeciensis]|uniref:Spermidine/putrescine import ATP-binding protein PotA n=1 Tax=Phaeobacter gallaeciensis TaxID=60890 RepID=A0A1B0ZPP5_9RHOB|nr:MULTISPECIES: ABC transporter ATP-binding protein [Phaeobacter]MDF1772089.1 ABC transporter ATP-binding protein [Pseudophaeobacter sp. bin_em_oilr2.035]MEE2817898.1 ABC transporter ATP-binding protein [Pseudomonadota bacterium]ANP36146.1 spermidine/putrescine ABC transporter ATP-binding protein [Phaeobacter gallaeciensis]MDE4062174.1 ABC transporter ATP-binding protein [Phaeobacter gallaeciensis]MDE4125674.1 ABC transporter ATP-binding protein [Phaeobacter gallaeciensis]